jgi:hypothetical protein
MHGESGTAGVAAESSRSEGGVCVLRGRSSFPTRFECWGEFGVTGGDGCHERECGQGRPELVHQALKTPPRGSPFRCLDKLKYVGKGF